MLGKQLVHVGTNTFGAKHCVVVVLCMWAHKCVTNLSKLCRMLSGLCLHQGSEQLVEGVDGVEGLADGIDGVMG